MPAKERLIGILALLGFVAALIVHLPTQFGYDISKPVPMLFWALHGGAIMAWVLMSNSARNAFGKRLSPQEWLSVLPDWATWGKQILGAYALVNFAVFTYSAYRGSPAIRDGHYVLQQHGHIVRMLSLPEYEAAQLAVMRGFSGHWLVFYFTPAVYFLFRKNRRSANPAKQNEA